MFFFQYLTQLDMSENSIEFLDLSALDKIESIQCCKNQIKELTLNGRVLNSLVASNNRKLFDTFSYAKNIFIFLTLTRRFMSFDCEAAAKKHSTHRCKLQSLNGSSRLAQRLPSTANALRQQQQHHDAARQFVPERERNAAHNSIGLQSID